MNEEIFYSLSIEDIQTVANDEIGRDLNPEEIKEIIKKVEDRINWYDAIADSINEYLYEQGISD